MSNKQMATSEKNVFPQLKAVPASRREPAVDIYETDHSLFLVADMPGVEEKGLRIEVERGVLTLAGETRAAAEDGMRYHRQFRISDRFDAEAGEAALKDGVLTLKLPKTEAATPKRIAVKALH